MVELLYGTAAIEKRWDDFLKHKKYVQACNIAKRIAAMLAKAGAEDTDLLAMDYFLQSKSKIRQVRHISVAYLPDGFLLCGAAAAPNFILPFCTALYGGFS